MTGGATGVCQSNSKTCAINITPPNCVSTVMSVCGMSPLGTISDAAKLCTTECSKALQGPQAENVRKIWLIVCGEPKNCPEICTMEYAPVCGSNQRTYSNKCGLEVDSCKSGTPITVAYPTACRPPVPPEVPIQLCSSIRFRVVSRKFPKMCLSNQGGLTVTPCGDTSDLYDYNLKTKKLEIIEKGQEHTMQAIGQYYTIKRGSKCLFVDKAKKVRQADCAKFFSHQWQFVYTPHSVDPIRVIAGRPYVASSGQHLTAPLQRCMANTSNVGKEQCNWAKISEKISEKISRPKKSTGKNTEPAKVTDLDQNNRMAVGSAWSTQGLGEHASVASFSKFSLQLMSVGAPPHLLMGAHQAAIDEIHHAQLCFSLSALYSNQTETPGNFPVEDTMKTSLLGMAVDTFVEGCVHETLSALEASIKLAHCTQPTVRATLSTIVRDEATHAALAWGTLRWAVSQDPTIKVELLSLLHQPVQKFTHFPSVDLNLPNHGFLPSKLMSGILNDALENYLLPWGKELVGTSASSTNTNVGSIEDIHNLLATYTKKQLLE